MIETFEFGCAVCEARGTLKVYESGKTKVEMSVPHAHGCEVRAHELGKICPACGGTEIDGNETDFACLDPECGCQWERGSSTDVWYTK